MWAGSNPVTFVWNEELLGHVLQNSS
jgi:hypothetical protein